MKKIKTKGLSLIEIIAAIAILGIVLVSVSTVICTITQYNYNMKCKIKNSTIAQEVMEAYKGYDFSSYTAIKTEHIEYEYLAYLDNSTGGTFINESGTTVSSISTEKPTVTGSSLNENYNVLSGYFPKASKFDHIVKVIFTYTDNMIDIDTTVYDSKNNQVEYVTLKRY